jgi:hypothetical protein
MYKLSDTYFFFIFYGLLSINIVVALSLYGQTSKKRQASYLEYSLEVHD